MLIQYSTCSFSFTYIHCTVHVYAYLATYTLVHCSLMPYLWRVVKSLALPSLVQCTLFQLEQNTQQSLLEWTMYEHWMDTSLSVHMRIWEPHLRAMQSHFPSFLLVLLKTLVVLNVPWLGLVLYANSVCSLWAPPTCSSGDLNTCTSVGGSVWMYINVHSYTHLYEFVFYTGEPAPATRNM